MKTHAGKLFYYKKSVVQEENVEKHILPHTLNWNIN